MTNEIKTKTLKQLKEATGDIVKNIIQPSDLREIKMRCKQLTASFQPSVEYTFEKVESILNYFGYTLGELEQDGFENSGDEDLFILTKADGEVAKNAFINVCWEKLASGQQAPLGQGASALRFDVEVYVNEVSPSELQSMLDAALTKGMEPMYPDEDSGPEENKTPLNSVDVLDMDDNIGESAKKLDTFQIENLIKIREQLTENLEKVDAQLESLGHKVND